MSCIRRLLNSRCSKNREDPRLKECVDFRTQFSTFHTAILSKPRDERISVNLSKKLQQDGKIIVHNKIGINSSFDAGPSHSHVLLEYIKANHLDALIILGSKELKENFDSGLDFEANLGLVTVRLKSDMLSHDINENICKITIVVYFCEEELPLPVCFRGAETLALNDCRPDLEISRVSVDKLEAKIQKIRERQLQICVDKIV